MKKEDAYGIIGIIALIIGILHYFNLTPKSGIMNMAFGFLGENIIFVILVAIISLLLWVFHFIEILKSKNRIAQFFPRSERSGYFWGEFRDHVESFLKEKNYQILPAHTEDEYNDKDQTNKFNKFKKSKKVDGIRCGGIIISPAGRGVLESLERFLGSKKKVPLVIHDITPEDHATYFADKNVRAPYFVTVDNKKGGELAADILRDHLRDNNISFPYNIIIIPGDCNHTQSIKRIEGFQEKFREFAGHYNVDFSETKNGDWNYESCELEFNNFIIEASKKPSENMFHGIFACNDEMALAANKVIDDIIRNNHPFKNRITNCVIIGFDGTKKMRREIRNQNSRIIGTVDAKIKEQAEKVGGLIINIMRSKSERKRLESITMNERKKELTLDPEPIIK